METQEHIHKTENPDSIDFGGGAGKIGFKVYHSADDPEGFKKKIKSMIDVRKFAQNEMGV